MQQHFSLISRGLPILFFLLQAVGPMALAQSGAELYAAEVPVASKSAQDRSAALDLALRQVIGKLTGLANPQTPVVDEAAANAQSYLQQFQYRGQVSDGELSLWARFNSQAMDAIVVHSGLPQWSRQRPAVLTWIALRSEQGVELFNLEDPGGLAQAIRKSAWQRGLPLEFPLLDLEDRSKLTAENVWSLDSDRLLAASQRYGTTRIFVARIEQGQGDLWTARWNLLSGQDIQNWSSQGTSMKSVVSFGINSAADRIAQSEVLAPAQTGSGQVLIHITGVRNLSDYARTLKYLQSFEQVQKFALREVHGDELSAKLTVRGGAAALGQLISFGQVLKPQMPTGEGGDQILQFTLLP